MNANLADEMQAYMKPFYNMAQIQMRTAQKLMQAQMELLGDCMDLGTQYSDATGRDKNENIFFWTPLEATREINKKFINSASRQWDILLEARDDLHGVAEETRDRVRSTLQTAQAEAQRTAEEATSTVDEVADKARNETEQRAAKASTARRKSG